MVVYRRRQFDAKPDHPIESATSEKTFPGGAPKLTQLGGVLQRRTAPVFFLKAHKRLVRSRNLGSTTMLCKRIPQKQQAYTKH